MSNLVNNFIWNGTHWTRMRGNQNGSLTVNGDIKITDRYGNVESEGASYKSVFGEQITVPITPVIQLDGLYGLPPKDFETFTASPGTATTNNNMLEVSTGSTGYGYSVIRSTRVVRYRPGQGSLSRFTAKFTETDGVGTLGYTQRAGFFTQEQALQIGFDTNGKFGILRQNGGKAHISSLTITSGSTSAGSVVITLNNTGYTVPLTDTTGNINFATATIGVWFQQNASDAWTVDWHNGFLKFVSTSNGPKTGLFLYLDSGSTGSAGTFSTPQTGVVDTNTWTYQEDWNDPLDGSGVSGIVLDHSKLNIYQIDFRWLGIGVIRFAIENPNNGDMYEFHRLIFSNIQEIPHMDNPTLKLGYVAARLPQSPEVPFSDVKVCGGSLMGAVQGLIELTNLPSSVERFTAHSGGLTENVLHHGLTIHNRLSVNDKINLREVIIQDISIAIDTQSNSGKPVQVLLFSDFPVEDLPQPFVLNETGLESQVSYSKVFGVVTQGTQVPIANYFSTAETSTTVDLSKKRVLISPNKSITALIRSTVKIVAVGLSFTYIED